MIGRYDVVSELGTSATGVVYLATDRVTGTRVALRVVTSPVLQPVAARGDRRGSGQPKPTDSWLGRTQRSRISGRLDLSRQLRMIASLHHPNLVGVLDYGFDGEMRPYYTQRIVEDCKGLLESGRGLPFEIQVGYVLQILQGLTYLHHRHVVHGDLRPKTALADGAHVWLVNFGLPALHPPVADDSSYLAPEIRRGGPVSPAADLFAVGVLAWELLSGRDADRESDLEHGLEISTRDVDARLIPVLERLLATDQDRRYLGASQVIADLCAALGQPFPEETAAIRRSFLETGTLVGRHHEMERLTSLLKVTLEGRGEALLIAGESGVGKSRLLEELRSLGLAEGAVVLWGRAVAEGFNPFYSWRHILRHLCLVVDVDAVAAPVLKGRLPELEELLGRDVAEPPALDPQAAQWRFRATVCDLFSRLKQPAVVILEDVHWAGSESLALLEELRRHVSQLPLLLVATFRDDERPDLSLELSEMPQLKLPRLDRRSIARLSESMLGPIGRRDELVDRLERETGGNAYFLIEVVRALAEDAGRLDRIDPSRLPRKITSGGIQEIVERRLNRLPKKVRPLLRLAAVAGRDVDVELLKQLEPGLLADLWLRFCADQAVLETVGGRWRFASDCFREALIDGMSAEETRDAHRRLAEAITVTRGTGAEQASTLAYHWTRASDVNDPEATALAVDYLERAGHAALASCAHREAVRLLTRGLELLATLPPAVSHTRQEIPLQIDLGAAFLISKGFTAPEAGRAFSRARSLAEQTGDRSHLLPTLIGLWRFHIARAELETARRLGDEMLSHARAGRAWHRMLAEYAVGTTVLFQGDPEGAARHLQRSIDLFSRFKAGSRREIAATAFYLGQNPAVAAHSYSAWATWCLGYPKHALNLARRARALADELKHPFSQTVARLLSAWLHQLRDDPRATEAAAIAAIELSEQHGFSELLAFGSVFHAWARARLEPMEAREAAKRIRDVLDSFRAAGRELFRAHLLALEADACCVASRPEDALRLLEEAVESADSSGSGFWKPELHRLRGELYLQLPRANRQQAESCFERALACARERGERSLELRALLSLARLLRGDHERLPRVIDALGKLRASFSEGFDTPDLITAHRLLEETE